MMFQLVYGILLTPPLSLEYCTEYIMVYVFLLDLKISQPDNAMQILKQNAQFWSRGDANTLQILT